MQADGFGKIFGTVAFQRPRDVFAPWLEVQSRNSAGGIFGGPEDMSDGKKLSPDKGKAPAEKSEDEQEEESNGEEE